VRPALNNKIVKKKVNQPMSVVTSPSLKDFFQAAKSPASAATAAAAQSPSAPAPAPEATPRVPLKAVSDTPRASNLPQPAVFAKHSASPFAPACVGAAETPSPAHTPASAASLDSDPPTPTFHGTPPVTPFLTQRRGRCEIQKLAVYFFSKIIF
jgi:hypothetical protein